MPTDILSSSRHLRRKRLSLKMGLVFISVLLVFGGIISFFYIPKFRIGEISVEDGNILNKQEFTTEIDDFLKRKFWEILPYDNIFIFPQKKLLDEILPKFPIVKSAVFQRDFLQLQKISVFIEERKPAALWCRETGGIAEAESLPKAECAFADETGFIFQLAPNFSGEIFLKFFDNRQQPAASDATASDDIGKNVINPDEFQKLIFFVSHLLKENLDTVRIIIKDDGTYEVHLKDKWYVLLNDKNEVEQSFTNLQLVLNETIKEKSSQLEYVDLRFGNKIFYKLK